MNLAFVHKAYERGVQEIYRTRAREDKSTHAKFFSVIKPKIYGRFLPTVALVAIFENLSMVAVLSLFSLLYKQDIQILTRT